jgi:hypothetical protein
VKKGVGGEERSVFFLFIGFLLDKLREIDPRGKKEEKIK